MTTTKEKTVGNLNLVSSEEERLSAYLKETNLDAVNASSAPVHPAEGIYIRVIKRVLDLLIAVPAFLVFLPFNLIFGVCTYFDVGRPIFFKQTRVGKDGQPFEIVKFRNMNNNTDADGKLLPPKYRVTKFGRFMRKFSLDELLNFWSVIKGDMSIIGPRPLPVTFHERMSDRHRMRSAVRPGLECPRVIPSDLQYSQYQNQFEHDLWYVEHVSFKTDVSMLVLLVKMTFDSKYRSKTAGGASYFVGYDEDGYATSFKHYLKGHPNVMNELEKKENEQSYAVR